MKITIPKISPASNSIYSRSFIALEKKTFSNVFIALILFLQLLAPISASAEDSASGQVTFKSAWDLYTGKQYGASADAFEVLLKKHRPSARLFYYASLANFSAHRKGRARQLCTYIVKNFSSSGEANHAKKMFPELVALAAGNSEVNTDSNTRTQSQSDSSKKETGENEDPAVRAKKLKAILEKKDTGAKLTQEELDYIKAGETKKKKKREFFTAQTFRRGENPFTAADIAKDGANGIDQGVNPNCWFEASMSALAELPRGQRLIASMIRYGSERGSYIVRFPGDGKEYKITEDELKRRRIRDRALWASLLSCAQVLKFPGNIGANGASGNESRLAIGLGCITGCPAQLLSPGSVSEQQVSSFIHGAVSSKNPIVCSTWDEYTLSRYTPLVVGAHAYTITAFDPASKMITIRNPHGSGSDVFEGDGDTKRMYEHVGDGSFKMHLSLFQKYFYQVCRSFI